MTEEKCIFCRIAQGEASCFPIWEDEKHLAFLSIYPNTPGFTVLITKGHYPSDLFSLPDKVLIDLILAAKRVAKLIGSRLEDVGRTGLVFEGFGVNHAHAKLIPMHGTKLKEWRPLKSTLDKYFEEYEGYLSSHDYRRASDSMLGKLAQKIRRGTERKEG